MKYCAFTLLLLFINSLVFTQISDKPAIKDTTQNIYPEFDERIQNYNYNDTINDSFAAYLIKSEFKGYKISMKELMEDSLKTNSKTDHYLFRILSLPSFNHPICFTITTKNEKIYLNWTVGKGAGGYKPEGIKKKGRKKITNGDWDYFLHLIDISSIDTLPLVSFMPMNDGTSWVIEKNINNNYKIHFTNFPPSNIENAFALMSYISNVRNKEYINFYGGQQIIFFNKYNIKINLDSIREKVILHLNNNFSDKLLDKDYCFDCGIYIKIGPAGKIRSVKYIPYILPHRNLEDRLEYFEDNFSDRKFRKELKVSFRKLSFSELHLSRKIWIPVYIKYNKETILLEVDRDN